MKLFHLSENKNLTVLTPRIPETAVSMYENISVPRVCFAKSISGCLSALQGIPCTYYVYVPVIEGQEFHIPTVNEVRDGMINGEVWCINEIKVHCIGKIRCSNWNKQKEYFIERKQGKRELVVRYFYPWKWVEKYF